MSELTERALKCLDYRLTGSEGVIALNAMSDFAALELAALKKINENKC